MVFFELELIEDGLAFLKVLHVVMSCISWLALMSRGMRGRVLMDLCMVFKVFSVAIVTVVVLVVPTAGV